MKKMFVSILVCVLVLVLFTGCSSFVEGFKEGFNEGLNEALEGDSDEVQVIKSDYSSLAIEVPKTWKNLELIDMETIQMGNMAREQYLIVIEESALNFENGFTVDEYTNIILNNMKAGVELDDTPTISNKTVGNNKEARQFELTGTVEKVKIKYLVTCFEKDDTFYQITAWSIQSKYDAAKVVFESILESVSF